MFEGHVARQERTLAMEMPTPWLLVRVSTAKAIAMILVFGGLGAAALAALVMLALRADVHFGRYREARATIEVHAVDAPWTPAPRDAMPWTPARQTTRGTK